VEESTDQFRSWEEASQAGKKALEEIISKSCRTPSVTAHPVVAMANGIGASLTNEEKERI